MQNSIHSRKEKKTFWKKFEKILLVVHLSFLHGKQLSMKLLFEIQQFYANLLLGLTLANYTPTRWFNPCRPVFWDFDSETITFIPWQNQTRSFENMVMFYFQRTTPECEIESFFTTGRQKKIGCFSVDEFYSHCNTVFEAMGCFYHFCPCQELHPSLIEKEFHRDSKKREFDALRRHYIQEKGYKDIEMLGCECCRLYKWSNTAQHKSENTFHTDVHFQLSNF